MNRLLILACSERKKPLPGRMPAIERYDGPAFRVLRKFLREKPRRAPEILILSAKFGLIGPAELIPDYDCRLTSASVKRLQPSVHATLGAVLRSSSIKSVGLSLGREYGQIVKGLETSIPTGTSLTHLSGGLGRRLTLLRDWLHFSNRMKISHNKGQ